MVPDTNFVLSKLHEVKHHVNVMNILASRNLDSGAVETYIPDTETAFDWLNYHS